MAFEAGKSANRTGETNSGDLMVDAMRWYFLKEPDLLKVPEDHLVAMVNGGSIRAGIPQGDVTKKTSIQSIPFPTNWS